MQHPELAAWLRLLNTPGIGNSSARKLLAALGPPAAVFEHSEAALSKVVSPAQAQALLRDQPDSEGLLARTWDWLQADAGRRVLALGDPLYPQILLQIEDPPLLLYAMAAERVWQSQALNTCTPNCLAMVGSRNPSGQGIVNAQQLAQSLAAAGLTIVSGLALGVDGAAHRGALAGAAPGALATIAVGGTGLDRVHPSQHRSLAHQIAQDGVLLSEWALGTPPLAANFPRRNRIIAGLARGTLVVEATLQSGSLITARLASEQGREVFAVPGSIHSPQARGCHALIKQGAKLVERAQDVLDELDWSLPDVATLPPGEAPFAAPAGTGESACALASSVAPRPPAVQQVHDAAFDSESPLLRALGHDPVGVDALQARSGLSTAALMAQLMELQLQGLVERLPGGRFQRLVRA